MKKNSELGNANLGLERLYVLTGSVTASASEAVVNCLIPYMGRTISRLSVRKRLESVWEVIPLETKKIMNGCCIRSRCVFIMLSIMPTMPTVLPPMCRLRNWLSVMSYCLSVIRTNCCERSDLTHNGLKSQSARTVNGERIKLPLSFERRNTEGLIFDTEK